MMSFSFENMKMRFPHLFEDIFVLLHPKDLARCRYINRFLKESLEKFWWMRKIQFQLEEIQPQLKNSYPEFTNHWRLVVTKTSLDSLKQLHGCLVRVFDNITVMNEYDLHLSPIIVLSAFGNVKLLKKISAICKNVYPKNQSGFSLLHIAVIFVNVDTFKVIAEGSDEKNPSAKNGCTPLHAAAITGSLEIFRYMIQTFEGVYESCVHKVSPLHSAAEHGQFEICKFIIENGSSKCTRNSNKKNSNWAIPLHYAAMNGSLETCMLLWEHFEEKNVPDTAGRTPLHYAAKHGQLDVYNFILANVDEKKPLDILGHTPISYAKNSKCRCHNRKFIGKPQCKTRLKVNPRPRVGCFKIKLRPCQGHD